MTSEGFVWVSVIYNPENGSLSGASLQLITGRAGYNTRGRDAHIVRRFLKMRFRQHLASN